LTLFAPKKVTFKFQWHKYQSHLEEDIQSLICLKLDEFLNPFELTYRQPPFLYESSLEGIKLTKRQAAKAKALGMKKGVTDLRFYFPSPVMVCIELKRRLGSVSKEQKQRHAWLKAMGFEVHVVKAKTPKDGWDQVLAILTGYGL